MSSHYSKKKLKEAEIRNILKRVREELEALSGITKSNPHPDLSGWCALSSYIIFRILRRKGYRPKFCANYDHAFIKHEDKVIDVTITQFSYKERKYPRIWFRRQADARYHKVEKSTTKMGDIWKRICRGWNQPVGLNNPLVKNLITNL